MLTSLICHVMHLQTVLLSAVLQQAFPLRGILVACHPWYKWQDEVHLHSSWQSTRVADALVCCDRAAAPSSASGGLHRALQALAGQS